MDKYDIENKQEELEWLELDREYDLSKKTVELNAQEMEYLLDELRFLQETQSYSKTAKAISEGITRKIIDAQKGT